MPREPEDWTHSASVRFTYFARTAYDRDYPQREVKITRRYGCDTVAYFVEINGLMLYPSRHADRGGSGDSGPVAVHRTDLHRAGWRIHTHV